MRHTEFLYGVGNIGFYTIEGSFLQQPLKHWIPPSWLPPTDGHATGSLHMSKPNKVAQVEVVGTIAVPPIPSFINPLNQGMSSRVRTGVHTRAVGSRSVGHTGHPRYGVTAEGPRDEVTRSVVTRHCKVCEGSKTEGLVYFPGSHLLFILFQFSLK